MLNTVWLYRLKVCPSEMHFKAVSTHYFWYLVNHYSELWRKKSAEDTQKAVQQACFQKAVFLEVCKVLTSIRGYGISVDLTALENGIFHSHLKDFFKFVMVKTNGSAQKCIHAKMVAYMHRTHLLKFGQSLCPSSALHYVCFFLSPPFYLSCPHRFFLLPFRNETNKPQAIVSLCSFTSSVSFSFCPSVGLQGLCRATCISFIVMPSAVVRYRAIQESL